MLFAGRLLHVFLSGLANVTFSDVQFIQNVAARILTNIWRRKHITHVLRSLHRLQVEYKSDWLEKKSIRHKALEIKRGRYKS